MAIPFKTLAEPAVEIVAGMPIAKRGCLTVAEEMAIRNLDAELKSKTETGNLTPAQLDLELKLNIAAILIQSRLDKSWSLEKTKQPEWEIELDGRKQLLEPDMILLDALFEFFMHEQRRGKPLDELDELDGEVENGSPKGKSTGRKSFGNSDSATPTKNGSAKNGLATAQ